MGEPPPHLLSNKSTFKFGLSMQEADVKFKFKISTLNRVRYFRGRVSNFNQSEARKHCFLAFDWSKFETLPRLYRTLFYLLLHFFSVICEKLGKSWFPMVVEYQSCFYHGYREF